MKKNLFLLLALLCSVTFFTACGDDEDTSWQQLPKEEIKGENATLTVNGETVANGAVKFETKSAEQAVVTLSNVIIAYPQVVVDVTMEKQADGSFNFSGEKGMTTVPGTRATAAQPIIATVKVTGNVTLDGKVKVEASTVVTDPNGWAGTYELADYATGNFTIGEGEDSKIYNIVTAGALYVNWEGIKDNSAPLYSGILRGVGGMLLPQVLKTITLGTDGNITAGYMTSPTIQMDPSKIMGMMGGVVPTEEEVAATIPAKGWGTSPKNLAFWYEKEGKMYVKLNISVIVSQAMGSGVNADAINNAISTILNGDVATVKELIKTFLKIDLTSVPDADFKTLLGWVNNGFPMTVKIEGGKTRLYLDKDALAVLFKSYETGELDWWGTPVKTTNIQLIWTVLSEAKIIPEEMAAAGILVAVLGGYYEASTGFDLGLDLKAAK